MGDKDAIKPMNLIATGVDSDVAEGPEKEVLIAASSSSATSADVNQPHNPSIDPSTSTDPLPGSSTSRKKTN